MYYDAKITIPANTPQNSPVIERLKLTKGIIHRAEVEFPEGCAGLAHVTICQAIHQVFPTNPDGDFNSDNFVIAWNDFLSLEVEPYEVQLLGWNEDDTYEHTITVRIGILPREILQPPAAEAGMIQRIYRLVFGGSA